MADDQKESEIRWWFRYIMVPLGAVAVLIVWLGWHSAQHRAMIPLKPVVVRADAGHAQEEPSKPDASLRRPDSVSITVEVHPIPVPEAVDFVPTFDEFSLAFDKNAAQKMVLPHGEGQRTVQIELNSEGAHNYQVIAHQHEEMGPETRSPGNPGYSTFEGTGSIVLHNHSRYLIVVGGGTSYKDRVSLRQVD